MRIKKIAQIINYTLDTLSMECSQQALTDNMCSMHVSIMHKAEHNLKAIMYPVHVTYQTAQYQRK